MGFPARTSEDRRHPPLRKPVRMRWTALRSAGVFVRDKGPQTKTPGLPTRGNPGVLVGP